MFILEWIAIAFGWLVFLLLIFIILAVISGIIEGVKKGLINEIQKETGCG